MALKEIAGQELLRADGAKVATDTALEGTKAVGILFTATW